MGEKYPFLAYLGHLPTWTRAVEVGIVAFFALVGFREAERWFNPACPPATWQGALVFGVAAALLDLLDRYGSRQKRESGRFPRWVWVPSFAAALAAFAATGEGLVLAGMSAWVVLRTSTARNKPYESKKERELPLLFHFWQVFLNRPRPAPWLRQGAVPPKAGRRRVFSKRPAGAGPQPHPSSSSRISSKLPAR